ncbi:unnamed protein product [Rotaria sordida]|uniref:CENP-V/GFA domain-containing protein n=1 Tax=Rotaria sordida TaxID=392033 RepID=A0A814X3L8_9BILA|nr:unnamed protein product [Rotaria sordida]CAF1583140.1 unnamed protein product [Rotaria sordida]
MSSSSSNEIVGRCLCGEIKIKMTHECLTDKSYQIVLCHCTNCHRAGGGLASLDLILPEDKVNLLDNKSLLKKYNDTNTKSKSLTERYFCSQCGSPVYSKNPETQPKKIIIK